MGATISGLSLDEFDALPPHIRRCVFWEVDPETRNGDASSSFGDAGVFESEFDKEAWISGLLLEWGTCGQIARETRRGVVGTAFYAPPGRVPRSRFFPTSPVSADAVLLTSIRTEPGAEESATLLLDAVVADLIRRGVRAIEAFGIVRTAGSDDPSQTSENPSTPTLFTMPPTTISAPDIESASETSEPMLLPEGTLWADEALAEISREFTEATENDLCDGCMIDADFLKDAGFDLVASHPRFPRFRLELDQGLAWKFAVEGALEKLVVMAAIDLAGRERTVTPVPTGLHGEQSRSDADQRRHR